MMNSEDGVRDLATRARGAARELRSAQAAQKNAALEAIATALEGSVNEICAGNEVDMEAGAQAGMSEGLLDRLFLDQARIDSIASAVREVIGLPDPVGTIVTGSVLPNGLKARQVRVPMGVVGMIYEARPNVTVDAACLALKSGNAVLLRGGSAAENTNKVLVSLMREAVASAGLPMDAIASVDEYGRDGATALMRARGYVDLLIPRGGAGLINTVVTESLVPVIETGTGNCHVYVHSDADMSVAVQVVLNAKTHRVGVCNAAETLLLHKDVDPAPFLQALEAAGVKLHCDERSVAYSATGVPATEEDWGTEYLSLDMAVRVVDSLEDALDHIAAYSSGHTEAILTTSIDAANRFVAGCDSAAVMVNASTRFTDGGQLGLGAEIGISTQKLHARGPMGLAELTTTTWIIEGEGHIRG